MKFKICCLKLICTSKVKKWIFLNGIGSHLEYKSEVIIHLRLQKLFTQFSIYTHGLSMD